VAIGRDLKQSDRLVALSSPSQPKDTSP